MDDLLSGADSEAEAVSMFREASSIMSDAGMELAKGCSNSPVLFSEFGGGSAEECVKVLGVTWRPDLDTFTFVGDTLPADIVPTKRIVLSFIARLFDPLGFLSPYAMLAKFLFQELWERGATWDEPLQDSESELFSRWLSGLQLLRQAQIPRCYSAGDGPDWSSGTRKERHVFADASPKGYGAVVYLRVARSDGSFSVSMVMSKARVAPLKRQSLPRLELLGCQLAAHLFSVVRAALRLPSDVPCTLWTDSMIALGWVRGHPRRWKQYVSHRVAEIQRLTPVDRWMHCKGSDNPADLMTRGVEADVLLASPLWFSGPAWLARDDSVWRGTSAQDGTSSCSEAAEAVVERAGPVSGVAQTALSGSREAPAPPSDGRGAHLAPSPPDSRGLVERSVLAAVSSEELEPEVRSDGTAVLTASSADGVGDRCLRLKGTVLWGGRPG